MIYLFFLACSSSQDSGETENPENTQDIDTITVEDYRPDIEFSTAKECGECHPTHYEEWRQSMHAYAAHSPVFDAMAQKLSRYLRRGRRFLYLLSLLSVLFKEKTGASVAATRSEISKDSVSCEVCHSAVTHGYPVGNLVLVSPPQKRYGPYGSQETEGHTSRYSGFTNLRSFVVLVMMCLIFRDCALRAY